MKLLMFGATGQVASEVRRQVDFTAPRQVESTALRRAEVTALARDQADLGDPGACADAIALHAPDAVINAAAWTAVDKAEDHEAQAHVINAKAPGAMARVCAARDIPFLHVSTDYVFDGSRGPWREDDATHPLSAYGRTKLAGEQAVRAAGGRHVILRTAWVFSAHGANFVKTMLRLSETRDHLTVVADQHGGPTPASGIAATLLTLAQALRDGAAGGTYHYAGQPDTTWAGFARETFAQAGRATRVEDIPTSAYPTPARRPRDSRLDCAKLQADFGITPPDWTAALAEVLKELEA